MILEAANCNVERRSGRDQVGIVEVLPADQCPLLGLLVGHRQANLLGKLEIVDILVTDVVLGKLLSVQLLGFSPEVFDAHQVGPVCGIECEGHVVLLTPLFDFISAMVGSVVHVEAPLVARRQLPFYMNQSGFDVILREGPVLAAHVDLAKTS